MFKKRIGIMILALMLVLSSTVMAAEQQETATEGGAAGITFSNGYVGFCIDQHKTYATKGDSYYDLGSVTADNNTTKGDVSQKLKLLIVENFELIHKLENGTYVVRTGINDPNDPYVTESDVQYAIWNITDGQYVWGDQSKLINTANSYTGPVIPDEGYTKTLSNGDTVTFYFTVMSPYDTGKKGTHQEFFAYKIAVNAVDEEDTHEHSYSNDWKTDEDKHWRECACGDKTEVADHEGEVRDAVEAKEFEEGYTGDTYCEDCDKLLYRGNVIPATHEHSYSNDWKTDDTQHWRECACGDKTEVADHEGEVRDAVEAKEFEEGYTGDTYCEDCDELLSRGCVIPATHEHSYSNDWTTDEEQHWRECKCGDKIDVSDHEGEVRDAVEAKEFEEGYTGDTYCEDCDKLLSRGSVIPATHEHSYPDDWATDEEQHWRECACGDKIDVSDHEGEVRDAVEPKEFEEGYTGDTYCEDCDKLLYRGNVIPATHEHSYPDDWKTDDTQHWRECECGDKTDVADHEVELRDAVEPTVDEPGYTGDKYCLNCEKLIEEGQIIPKYEEPEGPNGPSEPSEPNGSTGPSEPGEPEEPNESVAPDEPDKSDEITSSTPENESTENEAVQLDESAETGDDTDLMIWFVLMTLSCVIMTGMALSRRKVD